MASNRTSAAALVTSYRERGLLLLAVAFLLTGILTLTLSAPPSGVNILRLSFAVVAYLLSFAAIHLFLASRLPHRDPFLLPMAALLTGWGILLIARLAINFLTRQAIWLMISAGALIALVRVSENLRWLRRFRYTWLFGGLALLTATLIFGSNPSGYGPRLWLGIGGVYFQPAELLKILMIAYLASYLAEKRDLLISEGRRIGRWRLPPPAYVGPLLAMLGLAIILLAWQQDLGAAMLFFFTFLTMLYLATGQWGYVAAGLFLFVLTGLVGYRLSDRVALRIDGWFNPWPGAADRSFQIVQSLLAFGAGGIFGQGLGLGSPTYIPAVHTDFVFAAIGEEFGLAGALAAVALYGVLLWRGLRVAARTDRLFEQFLAAGLTAGLFIQAWVIMAGNAKLAPITGVTLPFISYGGSSLLISFLTLAFILRLSDGGSNRTMLRLHSLATLYRLSCTLTLALALLALTCGYWAVIRAADLRARYDNPRRVLYEQRIARGRIVDRNGIILADMETGAEKTLRRRYTAPEAAPVVGYSSLRYGSGGIEAAFNAELRGEAGRSAWQSAWSELLHRPPQGRDVRLTLDLALQAQAQAALAGRAGAAVVLDTAGGDILAMASNPTFDPAHLEEMWDALRADPAAPLLNRAAQGLYQPGAALETIILSEALAQGLVELDAPAPGAATPILFADIPLNCATPPAEPTTLATAYAAACPAPFAELGEKLGVAGLARAVNRWGLLTPPPLEIPAHAATWDVSALSAAGALRDEAVGQGRLVISPLHAVLIAGTLANDGVMPVPHLVLDPQRHTETRGETILSATTAHALLRSWRDYGRRVSGHTGLAIGGRGQAPHAWFLGVAPADAPRYAVAVLIERAAPPGQAAEVGVALLVTAISE